MATIKAYTDIEQSRKLAEILPLESADMSWASNGFGKPFVRTILCKGYEEEICPCWSLAALLGVVSEEVSLNSCKDGNWNAMALQQNGKMISLTRNIENL